MRVKFLNLIIPACLIAGVVHGFDTGLTYHDQMLPAQATTLDKSNILLLAPSGATNGLAVAGSAVDVSAYSGDALLVLGLGARTDANHTSQVFVVYGFDSSPATALTNSVQTSATAKFDSYAINFDTLKGTNAALYLKASFTNMAGTTTAMIGSASVVANTAKTEAQTITGSAVDTQKYKSFGTIVASISAPVLGKTNFVGTVQVQSSANGSTSWANVSGKTATLTGNTTGTTTEIPYEFGAGHRYLRAVATSTNDAASFAVTINAFK